MWALVDGKLFKFGDLQPKKNCKLCGGCGYLATIRLDLNASNYREMVPCTCVKKVVRVKEDK